MTETMQILGEEVLEIFTAAVCIVTGCVVLLYAWAITMDAMDNIAHGGGRTCTYCSQQIAAAAAATESDSDDSICSDICSSDSDPAPDAPPQPPDYMCSSMELKKID